MNRSVRYAILGLLLMGSLLGLPTEGQAQQKTEHDWLKLATSYKGVDIYGRSVNMAVTLRANSVYYSTSLPYGTKLATITISSIS